MDAGRLAMARHRQRRPHALLSLTRIARLLQIGFDFAHLACGSYNPKADKSLGHPQALADLERAYGDAAWERMNAQQAAASPVPTRPAQAVESARNQAPPPPPPPLSSPPVSQQKADVMAVPLVRGEHGFLTLDWSQARPAG
jgi:hypothetical protein